MTAGLAASGNPRDPLLRPARGHIDEFGQHPDALDLFSSILYQMALTDFLAQGHFATHVRRRCPPATATRRPEADSCGFGGSDDSDLTKALHRLAPIVGRSTRRRARPEGAMMRRPGCIMEASARPARAQRP